MKRKATLLIVGLIGLGLLLAPTAAAQPGSIALGDDASWRRARAEERLLKAKEDTHVKRLMATPQWSVPPFLILLTESHPGGVEFDIKRAPGVTLSQFGGVGPRPTARSFTLRVVVVDGGKEQKIDCSRKGHDPSENYQFGVVLTDGTKRLTCLDRQIGTTDGKLSDVDNEQQVELVDCREGQLDIVVADATKKTATVSTACNPSAGHWVTYKRPTKAVQPIRPEPATAKVKKGELLFDWAGRVVTCPARNGNFTLTKDGCLEM